MSLGGFVCFAVAMCVTVGMVASWASGPVSRKRVERFARRQRLDVTATNGDQIIRYLATTRRWRVAGVAVVYSLAITVEVLTYQVDRNVVLATLFAGWFTGTLVAEIRVAHLARGARPAASLQPRRPRSYLSRPAWALVPVAAGIAVAVAAATVVARTLHRADPDWSAVVWPVVALATAGVVRAIQRAVLHRPQPPAAPDALAADDAIRSRSLHVLAGGGTALVLLCVTAQLDAMHAVDGGSVQVWRAVGVGLAAFLGWRVASAPWPTRRAGPGAAAPTTGTPVAQ
jgi:hypothetical protein